jgi:hypothetical protein
MPDVFIPRSLGIASIGWQLANVSRGGGVTLSGQEQVVLSPAARWTASVTFNVFSGRESVAALVYRSIVRRGRAGSVLVPETDTRGPGQQAGLVLKKRGIPHSDGTTFSDGTGYKSTLSVATLVGSGRLNATTLTIALSAPLTLSPGMRFSTPDYRLHEIDQVIGRDGAGNWQVSVLPWLRADYPAGTRLEFDEPCCRMRPATDQTGQLIIKQRSLSNPAVEFTEAV